MYEVLNLVVCSNLKILFFIIMSGRSKYSKASHIVRPVTAVILRPVNVIAVILRPVIAVILRPVIAVILLL